MMKDIHESIMVDAKELPNENMKECLKQITYNVKNTIDVAIPPLVVRNIQTTLTTSSQPPADANNPRHPTTNTQNRRRKYFIDDMDIEKTPNKRKTLTSSSERDNSNEDLQDLVINPNFDSATKTRASSRKTRLTKTLQKRHKQS